MRLVFFAIVLPTLYQRVRDMAWLDGDIAHPAGYAARTRAGDAAAVRALRLADLAPRIAPEGSVRGIGIGLGLGLVLPIVEQVARLHGGRVELRSALGEGSEFCLWLPRERAIVPSR